MGYRITKLISSLVFLAGGAGWAWSAAAADPTDLLGVLGSLPVLAAGLFFAFSYVTGREISSFNLLRVAVGGLLAALIVRLVGGGVEQVQVIQAGGELTPGLLVPIIAAWVGSALVAFAYYYSLWTESRVRQILENIFSIPELIGKLAFTLALLAIYRIGFHVPLPGINQAALQQLAEQRRGGLFGEAMEYFSMFTGGSLGQSTLFGLGIMPYISASIIFQLLANVIPALEKLQKEGPSGYKKIQEYTRYATVGLCLIQGTFYMISTMNQRLPGGEMLIYPEWQGSFLLPIVGVVGLTAGTVFLMWLGEQIDEYGIGNGISLLIMAGIVVRLPVAIQELANNATFQLGGGGIGIGKMIFLVASFIFVVAGAILITQGQRRIPIQQAKQTRGRRVYGGQRHYMPLRVNHGGVMPIIFASALMIFPGVLFNWLGSLFRAGGMMDTAVVMNMIANSFQGGQFIHTLVYVGMIFFFAYFWTTVNFRPKDMADQLRDMGHFIPGLRPGKRTADYLERVMERITYCGAAFLAVIAVLPSVISSRLGIPFSISAFLGGTGLLIMVSVTLDLVQRIEANLVMRNYGGFLGGSSRIKGARG